MGGAIADGSLRHWPGLMPEPLDAEGQQYEFTEGGDETGGPDFENMSRDEIEAYTEAKMRESMAPVENLDVNELLQQ
ncbi:MAG: hypothetical protein H6765_04085 [Candidatus Peribacteria bacterium]|nr:MAG: hypothetical protein H6765_04085 [Candidatus Peribacteria bacterium]